MIIQLYMLLIAILVSLACALPGIFLVLRGVALMSDAISHAVLPGIAIMFLFVHQLDSPLLIIGASFAGLLTVFLTELLIQTRRLKKDAAIGLVFPLFFSVGVIIISQYARNVHLDTDMVLLGELAFAPFNRLIMYGVDVGPQALWVMGIIVIINALFVYALFKELALISFDITQAATLGFLPALIHYGLMTITSITAVAAFDIVGSIVVVALMITPPATAYLLTKRLPQMVFMSIALAISSSILGYVCAHFFDVSIAGSIATTNGLLFICALLFSPAKGIVVQIYQWRKKRLAVAHDLVCLYLLPGEKKITDVATAFGWNVHHMTSVIHSAQERELVIIKEDVLSLTVVGYAYAHHVFAAHI
jgi:manganese/zinc/iron transport system permease protein